VIKKTGEGTFLLHFYFLFLFFLTLINFLEIWLIFICTARNYSFYCGINSYLISLISAGESYTFYLTGAGFDKMPEKFTDIMVKLIVYCNINYITIYELYE